MRLTVRSRCRSLRPHSVPVYILTARVHDEGGQVVAKRHAPFIVCNRGEHRDKLIEELEKIIERLEEIVEEAL